MAQDDRERGVGLWLFNSDATRESGWESPHHAPDYLAGLWDPGANLVGITNEVTVAELEVGNGGSLGQRIYIERLPDTV